VSSPAPADISVSELTKTYRVHKRPPGMAAALRSLFNRTYENVEAVKSLSFDIAAGSRVGFLGPNGAGKTTSLKCLAGLLHPTSGKITVAGHVPQKRERPFLETITLVMGQKQQLIWDLPPADTFALNAALYDVPKPQFQETVKELTELLALGDLIHKPTRQLSLGERMKCELVAALLYRPRVLFLDEPTIGLDVAMQVTVREFIETYNQRYGATVLLTSHYMADVTALCPRVIVIDKGKLLYDGDLSSLVKRVNPDKRVHMKLARPVEAADLQRYGVIVEHDAAQAVLRVTQPALREAVGGLLAALPVLDLNVEDPPLEDVMRQLFAEGAAERKAVA
jgi:ABC-2 type transport system ATP-binding protein